MNKKEKKEYNAKYKLAPEHWWGAFLRPDSYRQPLPNLLIVLRGLILWPFKMLLLSAMVSVLGLILFAILYIGLNIWWLLEWVYDVIKVLLGY
jgi:hypothetical protein